MPEIVVHPATLKLFEAYVRQPAHALLLSGDEGVGLGTLASDLASRLSGSKQLVTTLLPEKGLLSIDRIRALYEQTRSIQTGKRVIVIDDADTMSPDAQNALLKLLEEPVNNVHFILTTHHDTQLLATIRSRTQTIQVHKVTEDQSQEILKRYQLDETKQRQLLFLAGGKPAELIRLAENEKYFEEQATIINDARSFLQSSTYDRLVVIKKYTDRTTALEFLKMCAGLLNFSFLKQKNVQAAENMEVLDLVMKRIEMNGHVRTHLMDLVTKLH